MYLTNCWYAVGWAEEFGDRLVERQVCGEKLALFRKPDGHVAAIDGICPHRFASLAKGKIIGHEAVECPYHGIRFDSSGVCVHNPHGIIPPAARVRSYRAVERHSLLWLWWGNSEEADESLIPDFSCLTSAEYRTLHGTIATHAHYELVTDNLMDLSHVAFVHVGGIGGDSIQRGEHKVFVTATTIDSDRWCPDAPAPPVWDALFGNYGKNVDHWLNMRWDAPASMLLDVGVAPAGRPRSEGIAMFGAHVLTPKSERETVYYWAAARDFALDSEAVDEGIRASITHAFEVEDKPIIEDVQQNMGARSFGEMKPLLMSFDKGGVLARRMLADLIDGKRRLQPTQAHSQDADQVSQAGAR